MSYKNTLKLFSRKWELLCMSNLKRFTKNMFLEKNNSEIDEEEKETKETIVHSDLVEQIEADEKDIEKEYSL